MVSTLKVERPWPTSEKTSQQDSSYFFRLPCELRNRIYEEFVGKGRLLRVVIRKEVEASILSTGRSYEVDPKEESQDSFKKRRSDARYEQKPVVLQYPNGLSQTCRQAYLESNHLLYQRNSFSLSHYDGLSWWFVSKVHLASLQQIRQLSIELFKLLSPEEHSPGSSMCLACHSKLKLLRNFEELAILRLDFQWLEIVQPLKESRKAFMKGLLFAVFLLKQLRLITVTSLVGVIDVQQYLRVALNDDDIPGWIYACERTRKRLDYYVCEIIETLQRIHDPVWPMQTLPGINGESAEDLQALSLLYD